MKTFRWRSLSAVLGISCLVIGLLAAMNSGGTVAAITALGHTLLMSGSIIIAGVLISSAIVESSRKG
jgi:hypothetical protein